MNVATRAAPGCAAAPGAIVTVTPRDGEAGVTAEVAGVVEVVSGALVAGVAGWPWATSASWAGGTVNGQAIAPPASAETTRTSAPMIQREPAEERHGIGPRFPCPSFLALPSTPRGEMS